MLYRELNTEPIPVGTSGHRFRPCLSLFARRQLVKPGAGCLYCRLVPAIAGSSTPYARRNAVVRFRIRPVQPVRAAYLPAARSQHAVCAGQPLVSYFSARLRQREAAVTSLANNWRLPAMMSCDKSGITLVSLTGRRFKSACRAGTLLQIYSIAVWPVRAPLLPFWHIRLRCGCILFLYRGESTAFIGRAAGPGPAWRPL